MTMPIVGAGDLSMIDAVAEFYGVGASGTFNLNGDAGALGFRASSGVATIGVSQKNGCNNAVPLVGGGNMGLEFLRGASGANFLSFAVSSGPGQTISFGRGIIRTTTQPLGISPFTPPRFAFVLSIPSGETITSVGTISITTNDGSSGTMQQLGSTVIAANEVTLNDLGISGGKRGTAGNWYNYWDFVLNSNSGRSRRMLITWALDGSPDP